MNILYITQYFCPEVGATQNRALEMASYMVKSGHAVTVLTEFPNHPLGIIPKRYRFKLFERERYKGIEVVRSFVKASPNKSFVNRMLFYVSFMVSSIVAGMKLKNKKYDIVYATSPPLFVGLSGYVIAKLRKVKFVFEVRDLWLESAVVMGELRNRKAIQLSGWIERVCYRGASKIVVVTQGIRNHLIQKGIDSDILQIIPNGANVDEFSFSADNRLFKKELGQQDKFIILYAGIIGLTQGIEALVPVVRLLKDNRDILFLFVGEGPVKNELLRLQKSYKLDNLRVMGQMPRKQVFKYTAAADVCLVPLRKVDIFKSALPSKMFDAWACGRPIILTVDGEAREHLKKADAGIYVDVEDSMGIKEAIINLSKNPDLCRKYGRNGRQYVEKHFSRRIMAQKLEKCLLTVLNDD
jgi:glycosyltransferase involved in cell wall biosynthesis